MISLENVYYTYPFQEQPSLKNINLKVGEGEVCLVTGPSGCGKSTLMRVVNGLCPHFFKGKVDGSVKILAQENSERTLREIAEDTGTVFQDPELQFFALNVDDEIAFAHEWKGKQSKEIAEIVRKSAERFGLEHILGSSIYTLSEGQKQKLAIAATLSVEPRVVVLDEPSANLDPESTADLALLVQELKGAGFAVIIVDHRLYWLKDVADKVVVMNGGEVVQEGDFSILYDGDLCFRYGLRSPEVQDVRGSMPAPQGAPHIQVRDLCFSYKSGKQIFDYNSFSLSKGVTAIIGENGVGKTTLARILTGLNKYDYGEVCIGDKVCTPKEVLQKSSIILQNTDHQLHMKSVIEELAMASGQCSPKKSKRDDLIESLKAYDLHHLADRHPQSLSGGEKQRLVIACGLAKKPDILILDEPTSGLDGRNMMRIASVIKGAADSGVVVLIITHDLELLEECCESALRLPLEGNK